MRKACLFLIVLLAGCVPESQRIIVDEEQKTVVGDRDRELEVAAQQFARAWKGTGRPGGLTLSSFNDGGRAYPERREASRLLAEKAARSGAAMAPGNPSAAFTVSCDIQVHRMTHFRHLLVFEFMVTDAGTNAFVFKYASEVVRVPPPPPPPAGSPGR